MGENSDIEWLGHNPVTSTKGASGSPWEGCAHKHDGCRNCWAEALNNRWRGGKNWGVGAPRRVASGFESNARAFARKLAKNGERASWFPSICDPLDPEVWNLDPRDNKDGRADRHTAEHFMQTIRETGAMDNVGVFGRASSGIDWLLLTKRPENWAWIPEDVRPYCWLLYSASDQQSLEAGIGHLLAAQGFAGLGLSLEPLIGPVDVSPYLVDDLYRMGRAPRMEIDWVIIGGESGSKARPYDVAWPRSIIAQCREAGVPVFHKQLGARPIDGRPLAEKIDGLARGLPPNYLNLVADKKGGDMSEWAEDLRVREFPEPLRRSA